MGGSRGSVPGDECLLKKRIKERGSASVWGVLLSFVDVHYNYMIRYR